MSEHDKSKIKNETSAVGDEVVAKRNFRIVSSEDDGVISASSERQAERFNRGVTPANASNVGGGEKPDAKLTPEEENGDDGFFAKSFALNSRRRKSEQSTDAFAEGLRSLFDDSDDDIESDATFESDSSRFQRESEAERRESLDGVLRQEDADFLSDAGRKYDAPRNTEATREDDTSAPHKSSDISFDESVQEAKIRPESILEAMLFVGDRENNPLTLKLACELMRDVTELEAIEALADLNERYYRDGSPYKIVRCGEGYRLTLRQEYADFISRFSGKTKEFKLSQTAIDVLALIAYRQPIALEEILEARNNASSALSQLVKRELVVQEKQTVDKKKTTFYKTTERFLKLFNLQSIDELPIVGDIDYR
ncbi:MAG: SMC-Scp complex subunit ScpB [Thermoguttaceae bacterium]|nr:SMC-Scp complex subunit ScpB [Thermoguttaceae bacterium]